MNVKEIGEKGVDLIHLNQATVQWHCFEHSDKASGTAKCREILCICCPHAMKPQNSAPSPCLYLPTYEQYYVPHQL
jgi:hypothetical protein